MNDYEEEFLKYLRIKEIQENRNIIQSGGVIEKIHIEKHNIEYNITSQGTKKDYYLQAIATKKANDKQPCFMMHIVPGKGSELISVSRGRACFEDNHDNSADIVLAALEIAKLKGAKTFEFTDNSTKTVEGQKIRLSDLSFLTTGKTWYERILPIRPSTKVYSDDIENRRRPKVLTNTWASVYNNLINEGLNIDIDTTNININEPGSAMKVLLIAKKSKKYHKILFYEKNMFKLLDSSNIQSMHGIHWIMDITK